MFETDVLIIFIVKNANKYVYEYFIKILLTITVFRTIVSVFFLIKTSWIGYFAADFIEIHA
jgi:hypothetical protein